MKKSAEISVVWLFIHALAMCEGGEVIDKHNYGYVLRVNGRAHVKSASGSLAFKIRLPRMSNITVLPLFECNHIETREQTGSETDPSQLACEHLKPIVQTFQRMRDEIALQLRSKIELVYALIDNWETESYRGKRWNLFGTVISTLTGLATEDDLKSIKHMMGKVQSQVYQASQAWRAGSSTFMTAIQVENTRIDHINVLLEFQKNTIEVLYREMSSMFTRSDTLTAGLAKAITKLKALAFRLSEIDLLYSAIEKLVSGQLPHFLVGHNELQTALGNLDKFLIANHPDLTILHDDLHYYYMHADYSFIRSGDMLVILLQVPLTLTSLKALQIYEMIKIPLVTPGTAGYTSELAVNFYAVAFHKDAKFYIVIPEASDIPVNREIDIRTSKLVLHKRTTMSCPLAMFEGDLETIKSLCQYHVVRGFLRPAIFHLTDTTVLLSNITQVIVHCHKFNTTKVIELQHPQVVYHMTCDCDLETSTFFIHGLDKDCLVINDNVSTILTPKFVINLSFLSEFFSAEELKAFKADTLLNTTIDIELPKLAIVSKAYANNLALDKDARFTMNSLINKTKAEVNSYESLGDLVYNQMIENQQSTGTFNVFSILDWIIIASTTGTIIGLVWIFVLSLRLKALTALLTVVRGTHANLLPDRLQYGKSTTILPTTSFSFLEVWKNSQDYLQEFFPIDLTLLVIFLVIVIAVVVYQIWKKLKKRNTLILTLVFGNVHEEQCIHLTYLKYPLNYYQMDIGKAQPDITLISTACQHFLLWGREKLHIYTYQRSLEVKLPTKIKLCPVQVYALKRILSNQYYLILVIKDVKNDVKDLLILQSLQAADAGSATQQINRDLYPTQQLFLLSRGSNNVV